MGGCSTPSARRALLLVLTSAAANTVSVTKEVWQDSAASATAAAKPDWAAADRGCVATIASATPPYLSYDGRDTTKPKLCRVEHGGPVDGDAELRAFRDADDRGAVRSALVRPVAATDDSETEHSTNERDAEPEAHAPHG